MYATEKSTEQKNVQLRNWIHIKNEYDWSVCFSETDIPLSMQECRDKLVHLKFRVLQESE